MDLEQKSKIDSLISRLDCNEPIQCQKARRQLIKIGQAAVPALIAAASNGGVTRRWEAVRALGAIGGQQAVDALVSHLGDADPGMRWAAADALIKIGEPALMPVLKGLIANGKSSPFRDGVHHFLVDVSDSSDQHNSILEPVIKSLEEPGADLAAPVAAKMAIDKMSEFHKIVESG
jgi:HEAT repeat protein